jgi:hypothetical protein
LLPLDGCFAGCCLAWKFSRISGYAKLLCIEDREKGRRKRDKEGAIYIKRERERDLCIGSNI